MLASGVSEVLVAGWLEDRQADALAAVLEEVSLRQSDDDAAWCDSLLVQGLPLVHRDPGVSRDDRSDWSDAGGLDEAFRDREYVGVALDAADSNETSSGWDLDREPRNRNPGNPLPRVVLHCASKSHQRRWGFGIPQKR